MKLFKSSIYLLLFVLPITLTAQTINRPVCGTDEYYQELCKKDPSLLLRQQEADNLPLPLNSNSPMEGMATLKIIPVVFHVIHMNGTENLGESYFKDQIKRLNEDFRKTNSDISNVRSQFIGLAADLSIEFRMARIDPQGNCTNGITRYYSDLTVDVDMGNEEVKYLPGQNWDSKKYLNIWVVSSINSAGSAGIILGYSNFPWNAGSSGDGIVVRADRVNYNSRVLTHEIGHYLGLYHTFQGGCSNSNCSTKGDQICDTPPVADMNFGCNKTTNSCSTESPDQLDMIENYMDYTDCTFMFTNGQSTRVQTQIAGYRSTLYSTSNLQASGVFDTNNFNCVVVADFIADQYNVCAGTPVNFINTSFLSSNAQYIWEFQGGNPPVSFQKNQSVTYNTAGKYDVKLVVRNSLGKDSIIKQKAIIIYPQNGFNMPFYESFEATNLINDLWDIEPRIENIGWARTNRAAYTGSYSFYVNNFQCTQKNLTISYTLPPVNFTGITAPWLTFRHAFATVTSTHTDKLLVYASIDCGKTWLGPRYTRSQLNLPTTQTLYTTEFIANNPALWYYNQVDLAFFQNKPSVLLRFDFITGLGNNIYIDDIRVGSVTDIENNIITADDIIIYPNPASNLLYLKLPLNQQGDYLINIYDLLGNELFTKNISLDQDHISSINLPEAGINKNGTYLIRIVSKDKIFTKMFSVTE
jgi:PKD repeat protein